MAWVGLIRDSNAWALAEWLGRHGVEDALHTMPGQRYCWTTARGVSVSVSRCMAEPESGLNRSHGWLRWVVSQMGNVIRYSRVDLQAKWQLWKLCDGLWFSGRARLLVRVSEWVHKHITHPWLNEVGRGTGWCVLLAVAHKKPCSFHDAFHFAWVLEICALANIIYFSQHFFLALLVLQIML